MGKVDNLKKQFVKIDAGEAIKTSPYRTILRIRDGTKPEIGAYAGKLNHLRIIIE